MAKFEITFDAEMKTLSEQVPNENAMEQHLQSLGLTEVSADASVDEEEYTASTPEWVWSVHITAEFECVEGDIYAKVAEAETALRTWGLIEVSSDFEEDDYKMSEEAVLADFRDNVLPEVVAEYSEDDSIAKRETFNNYADALCKGGQITTWQYENIDNPY